MPEAPEDMPYRIVLRPIANPLPIGMLALLIATTSVAGLQLGWIPSTQSVAVGRTLIGLAVFLQLPGAAFGMLARDPAAGTAMAVLGGTWLAIGVTLAFTKPGSSTPGLGVFLLTAALALTVPLAVSLAKPVTTLVLGLGSLRFAVTGISELGAPAAWETAAGILGLALGAAAFYAAMALQLEDVHHQQVLPLGRTGPARRAMESGVLEQVRGVEQEAGVRSQL